VQPNEITEVLNRPISQELLARDLTRLAYVAEDGTPAMSRSGARGTARRSSCAPRRTPRSSRPWARTPAVALTIDTEVHPPKILLIRGRAELDVVDGISAPETMRRPRRRSHLLDGGTDRRRRSSALRTGRMAPLAISDPGGPAWLDSATR
jgi:hypothetical protein